MLKVSGLQPCEMTVKQKLKYDDYMNDMADTPYHTDDNQNPEEAFESIIKSDGKPSLNASLLHGNAPPGSHDASFSRLNVSELPGSSSDEDN
tara:strand:- start:110 stop:385 length:276 start_codon:yes stop_codon:yes gene_type:complete